MSDKSTKQLNRYIIRDYLRHAWQHKRYLILVFMLAPLAGLFWRFLPPLIVANILEHINSGDFVQGNLWSSFGSELLLYAAISILGGVFLWRGVLYFYWRLEILVTKDIDQRIFEHLIAQSADFHANRFGGSLVSQTNKYRSSYVRMMDTTVFQVVTMISAFIFTAIILTPRAPWVVLFIVLFSAAFMVVATQLTKKVRELNAIEASAQTRQTGFLADAITNVMAIKSFARSKHEHTRFRGATEKLEQSSRTLLSAMIKRDFVFSGSTVTLNIVALTIAAASAVLFEANAATVFLVFSYTSVINQYLWDFSQSVLRNYNRALGDASEMAEILQIQPAITDPEHPLKARIGRGSIELKEVTFTHNESHEALFKNLSVRIKAGEKVGLVGHSGSGKTTLTKLLLRFSDIDSGAILIDNQDIKMLRQEDVRSHISYVPQEPLLFHRSLKENISYGRPDASMEEITAIAKMAHAHDFIKDLPDRYDTLVGERGVKLSGGQRQRVAIARAMLKNAPILVLDEATSALDSESEVLIQDALWKLMEGRTAIVIAHRLSTIQKMDRILVMENGKIVEQGSHKELIRANGTYAELWNHQTGGFIEE